MSDKNIFRIGKGLVGLWIIITVVFSFFVMMGFFVSIPQASMDPKHEIFVAQERIDKEFPNSVHPIPFVMVCFYVLLTRAMALLNIRRAFLFNAEFEDHAEHVYAQFVKENPE